MSKDISKHIEPERCPHCRRALPHHWPFAAVSALAIVPAQIVVTGDASSTAANLMGQLGLFRLGVLADSAVILLEIAITVYPVSDVSHHQPKACPYRDGIPFGYDRRHGDQPVVVGYALRAVDPTNGA